MAVGRDMNGPAVREDTGELIVGHPRPVSYTAHIKMHKWRPRRRVVAYTAALQTQTGLTQLLQRRTRDVKVHRLAERMLAELRHAAATSAQHGVGGWRAVSTHHVNGLVAGNLP